MNRSFRILLVCFAIGISPTHARQSEFSIREADMTIKMPNESWFLATQSDKPLVNYIFKREAITDDQHREIVPAIMVFVEDASSFKGDVITYSISKRIMFSGKGMEVEKVLIHENSEYPLSYKNGVVTLCRYVDQGLEHVLFMAHIINKNDKGIQVYLDMTKSIEKDYVKEFWSAMKSINETK